MKLSTFLNTDNLIKKPYYYVPACPCCDSPATGRFLKAHGEKEQRWVLKESLKNGEIVTLMPTLPEDVNAYCLNCGYAWKARIQLKLYSRSQIQKEREKRMTEQIYYELFTSPQEKEKDKKKKDNFVARHVKKYIGAE